MPAVPSVCSNIDCTSACVSTVGKQAGCFARATSSSHGSGTARNSGYRNRIADSAKCCVAADTPRHTARPVRNASTSPLPSRAGAVCREKACIFTTHCT